MGNFIFSGDILSLGTITSRTEDANYPDDNVADLWHMQRRFRADDVIANNWLLQFDFGAAKSVAGVLLNFVNFDHIQIQADEGDWDWTDYDSGSLAVSLDAYVNRYKIYIPAVFNFQYMRIFIPVGTTAVGSYTTKWQVGTVVVLDSVTTLAHNINTDYKRSGRKEYEDIPLSHGGFERVSLGDDIAWHGEMVFGARTKTNEAELWTLNSYSQGCPIVVYENQSDTSKAYLCIRDDAYMGTMLTDSVVRGNVIKFKELI